MIQDAKLGTHRIDTYMYAVSKCAFLLSFRFKLLFFEEIINNVGVERGVGHKKGSNGVAYDALGSNFEKFAKM